MSQIKYDISYRIYGLMISKWSDIEMLSMIGINDNNDSMYLLSGEETSMNGILPSRAISIDTYVCCFDDNNYADGIIYLFGMGLKSFIQQPESDADLLLFTPDNIPSIIVKNNNNIYFVKDADIYNHIYEYDTNTNTTPPYILIDGTHNEIGVISSLFIKNDILYISNYFNEQFYISTYNFVNYNFIKDFIIIGNGSSAIEPGLITIGNDGLIYVSYFTNGCNYINVYTNEAIFMDTIQTSYTNEKLSGLTINKNNKLYFADKVSKSYTVLQSIYKHSHINEIAIGNGCAYVSDFVKNKIYMIYFDTTLTTFYPYEKITIWSDYSGCTGIIYSFNDGGKYLFIVSSERNRISKINDTDINFPYFEDFETIPNITGISSIVLSGNWFYIYTINSISASSSASIYKIDITNTNDIRHVLDCGFQYNNCKIAIDNENNLYILTGKIVYKYNYNNSSSSYGSNVQFITNAGYGPGTIFTNMLYYDNYFYFTNSINNNICKYNIFGTLITKNYTTGGFLRDSTYDITIGGGMAFDMTGNFYTADPVKEIIKIDYVTPPNFSTYGTIVNNYNDVYVIAIDNNNNLYVGNNNDNCIYKVDKLTGSNNIFFPLDGDGIDLTNGIYNIFFGNERFPNGFLYVLTFNKIYKINYYGEVVYTIEQLNAKFGIAIDINNYIYYSSGSDIYKIDNDLNITTFIEGGTDLINPSGIAFDSYGNVYIANNGNHYVSKYSSTGELINSKFIYVPNNGIVNIIIDKNNQYIYTAICYDANNKYGQYIYKYDISGAYISDIGFNDSTLSILGLALDLSNNLYFPNNRVNSSTNITKYTISPTGGTTTGGTTTGGTTTIPTVPCFNQDTKILTIDGYKLIQNLRKGDLIKTLNDGFKPIDMIGKRDIYHPAINERIKNQLYQCSQSEYPEIFKPLILTGCHSILVDSFINNEQREKTIDVNGNIYITDKKYRLPACIDHRATVYETAGTYTIYHLALENDNYYFNYGIYANGLLVETCSQRYLKEYSNMTLIE
jgi:hypothetical protein